MRILPPSGVNLIELARRLATTWRRGEVGIDACGWRGERYLELEPIRGGLGAKRVDRGADGLAEVQWPLLHAQLPAGDAGNVEQVFDDVADGVGIAANDFDSFAHELRRVILPGRVQPKCDRAQWRSQLVGGCCEEAVFDLVGLFGVEVRLALSREKPLALRRKKACDESDGEEDGEPDEDRPAQRPGISGREEEEIVGGDGEHGGEQSRAPSAQPRGD